jgi:hypothetical protein
VANRLAHEVLGRSLDELPPQTRRLLELLDEMVAAECQRLGLDRADFRFSRRQVREHTGWGNTQLKVHLGRLIELEYLLVHRGRQGQGYVYELYYRGEGQDGAPFLPGLLDPGQRELFAGAGREGSTGDAASRGPAATCRGPEATSRGLEARLAIGIEAATERHVSGPSDAVTS